MNFSAQRVEEIFSAAAILRMLKTNEFTTGLLTLQAEGIEKALRNNDLDHHTRMKKAIRTIRDEAVSTDMYNALTGVLYLLIPSPYGLKRQSCT